MQAVINNITALLRIHLLEQWYSLSDPAKEEALGACRA